MESMEFNKNSHEIEKVVLQRLIEVENAQDELDVGYAWVIVMVGFMTNFVVFGSLSSYDILKTHYIQTHLDSQKIVPFIGSFTIAVFLFGSVFSEKLDRYLGHRHCFLIGSVLFTSGVYTSGWAATYWQLIVTQELLMSFGGTMLYTSAISAGLEWFDKKRGLAFGIVVAGSGIGGSPVGPGLQKTISSFGIDWSLKFYSLISFVMLVFCSLFLCEPIRFSGERKISCNFFVFNDLRFLLLMLCSATLCLSILVPKFNIPNQGTDNVFLNEESAQVTGLIIGTVAIGQVYMGYLADRFGAINVATLALTSSAICFMGIWAFSYSFTMMFTFGLFYYFFSGTIVSLLPVICICLYRSQQVTVTMGFLYLALGIPLIVESPSIYWYQNIISDQDHKEYLNFFMYHGLMSVFGALIMFLLKVKCQLGNFQNKV